jgi:hypothetical protein
MFVVIIIASILIYLLFLHGEETNKGGRSFGGGGNYNPIPGPSGVNPSPQEEEQEEEGGNEDQQPEDQPEATPAPEAPALEEEEQPEAPEEPPTVDESFAIGGGRMRRYPKFELLNFVDRERETLDMVSSKVRTDTLSDESITFIKNGSVCSVNDAYSSCSEFDNMIKSFYDNDGSYESNYIDTKEYKRIASKYALCLWLNTDAAQDFEEYVKKVSSLIDAHRNEPNVMKNKISQQL